MAVEEVDLLIRGADAIDPGDGTYAHGVDITITGGKIKAIEKGVRVDAKREIDGHGKLFMPGLVDAHAHPFQIFLRGALGAGGLKVHPFWLKVLIPFEMEMSEEEGRISAQLSALNMIKKGITGFIDAGGPFPETMAEVADSAGLRARVTYSTMDRGPEGYVHGPEDNRQLVRKWARGRVRGWYSIRQIMVSSDELIEKTKEYALEDGVGVTVHIAEEFVEVDHAIGRWGVRPLERLAKIGLLGKNVVLAHAAFLTDEEVRLIAKAGATAVHCPTVNMLAMGFPKVKLMWDSGVNVALGSDGGSYRGLDLFTEMNVMIAGHAAHFGTPYFDYDLISSRQALTMATAGGANAMMEEGAGHLRPGATADLIAIDERKPNLVPMYNPFSISLFATGDDVTDVVVDGKPVMLDRQVLTLDEEKVIEEAVEAYPEIRERLTKYASA